MMALYRAETKPISRKDGRSAVAAAAYRSGASLVDERTGNAHDYTRRRGVVATGVIAPDSFRCDRNLLWNAAEAAEKRKDARTAREWVLALPSELDDARRLGLVRNFSRSLMERFGVAVDYAIHLPGRDGDQRNHHAHVLTTTRQVSRGPDGDLVFGDKAQPEQSDAQLRKLGIERGAVLIEEVRALWETQANAALEAAGEAVRVDRRSLAARGIDRKPTRHLGPQATAIERRGVQSGAGDLNRAIEQDNERRAELSAEIVSLAEEREQIVARQKAVAHEVEKRQLAEALAAEGEGKLRRYQGFADNFGAYVRESAARDARPEWKEAAQTLDRTNEAARLARQAQQRADEGVRSAEKWRAGIQASRPPGLFGRRDRDWKEARRQSEEALQTQQRIAAEQRERAQAAQQANAAAGRRFNELIEPELPRLREKWSFFRAVLALAWEIFGFRRAAAEEQKRADRDLKARRHGQVARDLAQEIGRQSPFTTPEADEDEPDRDDGPTPV